MTINIRQVLVRHLREFFETRLAGEFRWHTDDRFDGDGHLLPALPGAIRLRPSEMHPKVSGRRQLEKGIVTVDFDGYALQLSSPEEAPPIGKVMLYHEKFGQLEGPPDVVTWDRIANAIKSSRAKGKENVS